MAVGAAAGGLLAAAFLPMAVAAADEYVYLPDPSSFVQEPPSVTGLDPTSSPPFFDGQTGWEDVNVLDATTGTTAYDAMQGESVVQSLGGITATDYLGIGENPSVPWALGTGTSVDLVQFPDGWGGELVGSSYFPGEPPLLPFIEYIFTTITPFGDFTIGPELNLLFDQIWQLLDLNTLFPVL
jgi:hypothetical protein